MLVLPFLDIFAYLIVRGQNMAGREIQHAHEQQELVDTYIRETAAGANTDVENPTELSELKAHGDISEEEFRRTEKKILHRTPVPEG